MLSLSLCLTGMFTELPRLNGRSLTFECENGYDAGQESWISPKHTDRLTGHTILIRLLCEYNGVVGRDFIWSSVSVCKYC